MQDELGPPALAFVRTVCAVLALDSALEDQVAVLRRNLLKLVHVREFASASEFQVGLYTIQRGAGVGTSFAPHCRLLHSSNTDQTTSVLHKTQSMPPLHNT